MKKIATISFFILLLTVVSLQGIFAASYTYDVKEDQYKKEIKVTISVDAEGSNLNAFEGQLIYDKEALSLNRIETDNSIANAWPTFPEAGNSPVGDDTIYFESISQTGFSGVIGQGSSTPSSGKLLTLVFSVKREGVTQVSLSGAHMYLNDGDATEVPVRDIVVPLTLKKTFLKSSYFIPSLPEKQVPTTNDADVYGVVTKSEDVYDGQSFVAFENRNQQKSLSAFQIAESVSEDPASIPSFTWVTAKSPYLLTKTNIAEYVHIKALYTDGTYAYKTLKAVENNSSGSTVSYILGVLLFLALVIYYASPFKQKHD